MFEVGFGEIVLILGLALLVLGPERLPELAAKVGRWTGRARAMARQFQAQLEQEVTIENEKSSHASQSTPHYPDADAFANAPAAPPADITTASAGPSPEPLAHEPAAGTDPAQR